MPQQSCDGDANELKLVVPQQHYAVGDTIKGHVEVSMAASYVEGSDLTDLVSFELVVQLKCLVNLGEDGEEPTIIYDRRKVIYTTMSPNLSGIMTPGCHAVPFEITMSGSVRERLPPTLKIDELGDVACGVHWVVSAWVQALHTGGDTKRSFHTYDEVEVNVYRGSQCSAWPSKYEFKQQTPTCASYMGFESYSVLPQPPASFNHRVQINPSSEIFISNIMVELEMIITVRFKDSTELTIHRREIVGDAPFNISVDKSTQLTLRNCKITRGRPANFTSQNVDLVHLLCSTIDTSTGVMKDHSFADVEPLRRFAEGRPNSEAQPERADISRKCKMQ